ncbi:MAG: hypothetical protein ACHP9Y_04870, partial [Gammaproteobacteria bacterium]
DKHLTFLNPLKPGGNRRLFYKGKFYEGGKVVAARNPSSYGGARQEQRLLNDGVIPELHFADFPPYVIYENMLRQPFLQAYRECGFSESLFREKCVNFISEYYEKCRKANNDKEKPTVRELQQGLLTYLVNNFSSPLSTWKFSPALSAANADEFIATPATESLRLTIDRFILQHQLQHQNKLLGNGLGLNACFIQGEPGMGKSAVVKCMLERRGYFSRNVDTPAPFWYVKIDANLSFDKKRQLIIETFEQGQAVWIDEINSCMDELEPIFNDVLSGIHPDTKQPPAKPGFMAFFTGNSIALRGRGTISPAAHARCITSQYPQLKAEDFDCFLRGRYPDALQDIDINALATDLAELMRENPQINLRTLFENIPFDTIAELYMTSNDLHFSPRPKLSVHPAKNN